MASDTIQALEIELAGAESELGQWQAQAMTREDGSPAQDRRFEERGERLSNLVSELKQKIQALNGCKASA